VYLGAGPARHRRVRCVYKRLIHLAELYYAMSSFFAMERVKDTTDTPTRYAP